MSLVGCGSDAFAEILDRLGYETREIEGETRIARARRKRTPAAKKRGTSPTVALRRPTPPGPRPVDNDSPFAVLRELRSKMGGTVRPRRRKAKSG
jgi:hypothetical protein